MISETILHYPPEADLLQRRMSLWLKPLADKIIENLGEGGTVRRSSSFNMEGNI